jgi:hypothetical protein
MFASKTLTEHIVRGIAGLGLFAASLTVATSHPLLALGFVPAALVLLRGCPMCWTVGLLETLAAKLKGRSAPEACLDGGCSAQPSLGRRNRERRAAS